MATKASKKKAAAPKKAGKSTTPARSASERSAKKAPAAKAVSISKKKVVAVRAKKGVPVVKPAVKKATPSASAQKKASGPAAPKVSKARSAEPSKKAKAPAAPPKQRGLPPKKIEDFRVLLLQQHRELFESYMSSKGDSRSRQSDGTEDYIDYAVSSYDREFLLSLTELEQRQLMLIEDALRRLDRDEFGRCMHCGQQIPQKRLEVQPWARYCVSCQELEDQGLLEKPEFEHDEEGEEPRVVEDEDVDLEVESEVEYHEELGIDEDGDDGEEENLSL